MNVKDMTAEQLLEAIDTLRVGAVSGKLNAAEQAYLRACARELTLLWGIK